jgi:alkanesulfonate monooxygenase
MPIRTPDRINVLWLLPTHGHGRYLGASIGGRAVDLFYLRQVAIAADSIGSCGDHRAEGRAAQS